MLDLEIILCGNLFMTTCLLLVAVKIYNKIKKE